MRGKYVVYKLPRRVAEAKGEGAGARELFGDRERCERGATEIGVEDASAAVSNHVDWAHDGIRGHWQSRGKRPGQYEAEGVGQTWEHEDVGAGIGGGKPLSPHFADEMRSRKACLKLLPCRSIPNDGLPTRPIQRQESLEILFDRHTRAGKKNRFGKVEDARRTRSEKVAVDAMRPAHQTNKSARVQLASHSLSRHHHARAGVVESTKQRIDKSARRDTSYSKILREAGVVARRKRASGSAAGNSRA